VIITRSNPEFGARELPRALPLGFIVDLRDRLVYRCAIDTPIGQFTPEHRASESLIAVT